MQQRGSVRSSMEIFRQVLNTLSPCLSHGVDEILTVVAIDLGLPDALSIVHANTVFISEIVEIQGDDQVQLKESVDFGVSFQSAPT